MISSHPTWAHMHFNTGHITLIASHTNSTRLDIQAWHWLLLNGGSRCKACSKMFVKCATQKPSRNRSGYGLKRSGRPSFLLWFERSWTTPCLCGTLWEVKCHTVRQKVTKRGNVANSSSLQFPWTKWICFWRTEQLNNILKIPLSLLLHDLCSEMINISSIFAWCKSTHVNHAHHTSVKRDSKSWRYASSMEDILYMWNGANAYLAFVLGI